MIIIIIIAVLIGFYFTSISENFVPFNSFQVPLNPISTLYQEETQRLDFLLDTFQVVTLPDYIRTFQSYPFYSKFPLSSSLKNFLLNQLKTIILKSTYYKGTKIEFSSDIYNIWYTDNSTFRDFIFNIDLTNKAKAFTRKLLFYIRIQKFNQYTNDYGEIIEYNLNVDDIQIKWIGTNDKIIPTKYTPYDNLNNYYRILNTLYLMEPFLTSGKSMKITPADKSENPIIYKNGFCYNSTNPNASSYAECVNSGGVWDTTPQLDEECPYFQANNNYPNSFGSLKLHKCQLPQNMQIIGNRFYSLKPEYKPLCYNCKSNTINKGTLGFCCDEQSNKTKYPNLITPDFAFPDDKSQRTKYQYLFANNKLSVF